MKNNSFNFRWILIKDIWKNASNKYDWSIENSSVEGFSIKSLSPNNSILRIPMKLLYTFYYIATGFVVGGPLI